MKNSGVLLKFIAAVAALTLLVAVGTYVNMATKSADAAQYNWYNYQTMDSRILTFLGLPQTVAKQGTTMSSTDQRMFFAQATAATMAGMLGKNEGLSAEQSIAKYYCTWFKQATSSIPKSTGGYYVSAFGGPNRLYNTTRIVPDSALPYIVLIFEKGRGIDVLDTPLTGLPTC